VSQQPQQRAATAAGGGRHTFGACARALVAVRRLVRIAKAVHALLFLRGGVGGCADGRLRGRAAARAGGGAGGGGTDLGVKLTQATGDLAGVVVPLLLVALVHVVELRLQLTLVRALAANIAAPRAAGE
jgi:hypothetical protein